MNIIRNAMVNHGARADARAGIDSVEERVQAELGPRTQFDPVHNPEHAELSAILNDDARLGELREDIARALDRKAETTAPTLFTIGILVATAIEILGAVLIVRAMGVPERERLGYALGLALALVGLTAVTAHRTAKRSPVDASGPTAPPDAKRSVWTVVILASYAALVIGIAVLRIRSSADEESSQAELIAHALVMLATTLGPAWAVEFMVRKRAFSSRVRSHLATRRRQLRDEEKKHARAREAVNRIAREGAAWDAEAVRRRAAYRVAHRLAEKEKDREQAERRPTEPT